MEQILELCPIDDGYIVKQGGTRIGTVRLSDNPYHITNRYVCLDWEPSDLSIAAELFGRLRKSEKRPLQMMVDSQKYAITAFLRCGGFVCKRKCYEAEVGANDFIGVPLKLPLLYCHRGEHAYNTACRLMFASYRVAHHNINPWTAGFELFCETMPEEAICARGKNGGFYAAFVEGNEIAYVCGTDRVGFIMFARGVVTELLSKYPTVCFECDDCDPAAMELWQLFSLEKNTSFDTYVLE